MANVVVNGIVSAQYDQDEEVTVVFTKPDLTTETLTAYTLADKTFTVTQEYLASGPYSVKAAISEDEAYQAAESPAYPFTIEKATRTITLNVVVS